MKYSRIILFLSVTLLVFGLCADSAHAASSLTVTAPNGGERWVRGTARTITWLKSETVSYVKIELLKSGAVNRVITSSTVDDGSYSWGIPLTQTLGTDYRIRITSTSNPAITDSSDGNFAIAAGTLTVTVPNGGEIWKRGTTHTITWSKSGTTGSYVKIDLLKSGVVNRVIASSTANDGSYSWTIPSKQTGGTTYKIRITSTTYSSISDSSNGNFAIDDRSLTVTSPNGGETWYESGYYTIRWTSTGSPCTFVHIELLKSRVLVLTISSGTPNDGAYSWHIPTTLSDGSDYKIRIHCSTNAAITDSSNNNFSITYV